MRAGTAGGGECGAAAWLRWGTRSGLPGPACWGVTGRVPAAGGATPGCRGPAAREYSPKPGATTSARASATAQPRRRPAKRAAGTPGSRAAGRAGPVPLRSLGRGGQQLLQAYRRQHLRRPAGRVVLPGQRPGAGPDGPGDAADVPPRVEAAAAPAELAALDPPG